MSEELIKSAVHHHLKSIADLSNKMGQFGYYTKREQIKYITKTYMDGVISKGDFIGYLKEIGMDNFQIIKQIKGNVLEPQRIYRDWKIIR